MEDRKTFFDYAAQTFCTYGISIFILNVICISLDNTVQDISNMFSLGNAGLPASTAFQFLLTSVLITFYRILFFTDTFIKKMSMPARTVGMLTLVLLTVAVFILIFGWFPADMWLAWFLYVACFIISFAVSAGIMYLKEQAENKQMEEALKRLQNKEETSWNMQLK